MSNYNNVINIVIDKLTDGLTKSKSVCYQYKACSKIALSFLNEMEVYNFEKIKQWLSIKKNELYLGKYKYLRRIIYYFDAYIKISENGENVVGYVDSPNILKRLSINDLQLIEDYLTSLDVNISTKLIIKRYIAHFMLYLTNCNLSFSSITYNVLISYYEYEKPLHKNQQAFMRGINNLLLFLKYHVIQDNLKNLPSILYLSKKIYSYYKKIPNKVEFFCNYILDNDKIDNFILTLKNEKYSNKYSNSARYYIFIFSLYISSINVSIGRITTALIDAWANNYIKPLTLGYMEYKRIVNLYIDFLNNQLDVQKIYKDADRYTKLLPLWAKTICDNYLLYRKKLGYSQSTLCMDKNSILEFILYLNKNNIISYTGITSEIILDFQVNMQHSTIEGRNAYLSRIKGFIRYLNDCDYLKMPNINNLLIGGRVPYKIVSIISNEDVDCILNSSQLFSNSYDIKAYCIVLLGLKMGIRSVDITNLEFSNLHFKEKYIRFIQKKTKTEITLPMPNIVSNWLLKYIKNSRPKIDSPFLFIKDTAPYNKSERTVCGNAFNHILNKLGIKSKYKGFHITRKTFASNVLKNSHNIYLAAASLGHSDNATVDDYLNIDLSYMSNCSMSLALVPYGGFSDEK